MNDEGMATPYFHPRNVAPTPFASRNGCPPRGLIFLGAALRKIAAAPFGWDTDEKKPAVSGLFLSELTANYLAGIFLTGFLLFFCLVTAFMMNLSGL